MRIEFALLMMVVVLKVFSFSVTLALKSFAAGCPCFSKSNRESLETFMAWMFFLCLLGVGLTLLISIFRKAVGSYLR
ncbi:hypothetical protein F3H86_01150 [Aeromonas veronii]|nr:hypothetical protein [Aeromonas veronii]MBE8738279.1 hypothetical protein [Aeromonas veronii]MBE8741874.1 hypothetical protein [Aeromonas veronii]MBE8763224.1 hypothetical protein [Aeromonas veronii]MBE8837836.1 hypothetical protein [Aeromonas veronii]